MTICGHLNPFSHFLCCFIVSSIFGSVLQLIFSFDSVRLRSLFSHGRSLEPSGIYIPENKTFTLTSGNNSVVCHLFYRNRYISTVPTQIYHYNSKRPVWFGLCSYDISYLIELCRMFLLKASLIITALIATPAGNVANLRATSFPPLPHSLSCLNIYSYLFIM